MPSYSWCTTWQRKCCTWKTTPGFSFYTTALPRKRGKIIKNNKNDKGWKQLFIWQIGLNFKLSVLCRNMNKQNNLSYTTIIHFLILQTVCICKDVHARVKIGICGSKHHGNISVQKWPQYSSIYIYLKLKVTWQCIAIRFSEYWWVQYRNCFIPVKDQSISLMRVLSAHAQNR